MLCRPFGDLSRVWLCYVGPFGDLSRVWLCYVGPVYSSTCIVRLEPVFGYAM